jgi:hypothetical protein
MINIESEDKYLWERIKEKANSQYPEIGKDEDGYKMFNALIIVPKEMETDSPQISPGYQGRTPRWNENNRENRTKLLLPWYSKESQEVHPIMRRLSTDTPTPNPQCLFQKFETVAANHGRLRGSAGNEKRILVILDRFSKQVILVLVKKTTLQKTLFHVFWERVFAVKIMISDWDKNF